MLKLLQNIIDQAVAAHLSEDMKLSRSVSASIFSSVWPVCFSRIWFTSFHLDHLLGMNFEVSRRPFHPRQRLMNHDAALGRALRLPGAPAVSSMAPMLAPWPMQYVATSQVMYCMVS